MHNCKLYRMLPPVKHKQYHTFLFSPTFLKLQNTLFSIMIILLLTSKLAETQPFAMEISITIFVPLDLTSSTVDHVKWKVWVRKLGFGERADHGRHASL